MESSAWLSGLDKAHYPTVNAGLLEYVDFLSTGEKSPGVIFDLGIFADPAGSSDCCY